MNFQTYQNYLALKDKGIRDLRKTLTHLGIPQRVPGHDKPRNKWATCMAIASYRPGTVCNGIYFPPCWFENQILDGSTLDTLENDVFMGALLGIF